MQLIEAKRKIALNDRNDVTEPSPTDANGLPPVVALMSLAAQGGRQIGYDEAKAIVTRSQGQTDSPIQAE